MSRARAPVIQEVEENTYAPALTPEAEENQMIALATNLARKRMENGTASSQEIIHYLRLGSTKERYENEKLREEISLLKAKTDAIQSAQRVEELYTDAIKAFQIYRGEDHLNEDL